MYTAIIFVVLNCVLPPESDLQLFPPLVTVTEWLNVSEKFDLYYHDHYNEFPGVEWWWMNREIRRRVVYLRALVSAHEERGWSRRYALAWLRSIQPVWYYQPWLIEIVPYGCMPPPAQQPVPDWFYRLPVSKETPARCAGVSFHISVR